MKGAYYNENEPFAVEWLRRLILFDHIAPGDVDDRSIKQVGADDLKGYDQCHFFAGIGIWSHALRRSAWPDERPVWTGSCPCQPFSNAGQQRGVADERHLWPEWFRLIRERRPVTVFGEQVASKPGLGWFDLVSSDLEGAGYAVGAHDLCAAGVGAPHIRQRLWFVAFTDGGDASAERQQRGGEQRQQPENGRPGFWHPADWIDCRDGKRRPVEPATFPLAHGYPSRVGRLRAYGNAICPQVAQAFIEAAMGCIP